MTGLLLALMALFAGFFIARLAKRKPHTENRTLTSTPENRSILIDTVLTYVGNLGFHCSCILEDDVDLVFRTNENYEIEFILFPRGVNVIIDDRILQGTNIDEFIDKVISDLANQGIISTKTNNIDDVS